MIVHSNRKKQNRYAGRIKREKPEGDATAPSVLGILKNKNKNKIKKVSLSPG
jgi:hypothetical protein